MEEWKEVEGYTSYDVSNTGIVKERSSGKIMPQTVNGGFWCTNLYSDRGVSSLCKVHRLVAIAFIPNPEGAHIVAQYGDRLDTSANNQYWKAKKVKPAVVVKEEQMVEYLGKSLRISEFVKLCKTDSKITTKRLKIGWTPMECVLGWPSYKGEGYTDDSHWYPTLGEYNKAQKIKRHNKIAEDKAIKLLQKKAVSEGYVKDRLEYRKYGVGNFVNYPIAGIINRVTTNCYRVWDGMLARCYNSAKKSYKQYGAKGVYVCDEWLEFQGFASWWESTFKLEGWHLDKDILVEGNKVYSPSTCVFVPVSVNTFYATLPVQGSRDLPSGVSKSGRKYLVGVSANGIKKQISFTTIDEASSFYKLSKENHAKELADEYKNSLDNRVLEKLYTFILK